MKTITVVALSIVMLCWSVWAYDYGFNLNFVNQGGAGQWVDLLPSLSWSPSSKAFGNQSTNVEHSWLFTLTNSGNDTAEDIKITTTGVSFRQYSGTCPGTFFNLSTLKSCTKKIGFKPLTAGAFTGYINYSAPNIPRTSATLSGTGVESAVVSASDSFSYSDGNLATVSGGKWGIPSGMSPILVASNQAKETPGNYSAAYWNETDLTNDHCSKVTTSGILAGPAVRVSSSADTMYWFRNGANFLYSRVAGVDTKIGDDASGTPNAGDVIEVCAKGSTITVYRNSSLILTVSGDTSISSGRPGIIAWYGVLDNWYGRIAP